MAPDAAWLVAPEILWPFLAAVALVELTPGPNMAYLAALAAAEGRAAGWRAVAGITCGLAAYMLAAVFGATELIAASPLAYGVLRWAGVAYLFYLAAQAWRGAGDAPEAAARDDHSPFWRGLIANLLNPKAAVFYVTLLPAFVQPGHGPFWRQALILGCGHILVSIAVHGAIVGGAARAGRLLDRAGQSLLLRRGLAVSIAGAAVWVALQQRAA